MTNDLTTAYGALLLRVTNGVLLLAHGLMKLLVFTPAGTAKFFESLGLPGAFGYLTILAEVGGGLALILGVYTRLVSLALVPVMLGAIIFAHFGNGFFYNNAGGGWEFAAFWALVLGVQALIGDGAHALKPYTPGARLEPVRA